MATADGLRLFADALDGDGHLPADADGRITCEHHEDWTVLNAPDAELVSAKHREPSSGAWTTIKQLVDKGGLAHLFGRWLALDEKPNVRLVTCAALAPGDPRKLAKVTALLRDQATGCELDASTVTLVNEVAMGFAKELLLYRDGLPKEWQAPADATAKTCVVSDAHGQKVCSFLAVLFIDDRRPHREVTEHAAPSMYMQPILDKLDRRDVPASAVWEANSPASSGWRAIQPGHAPTTADGGPIITASQPRRPAHVPHSAIYRSPSSETEKPGIAEEYGSN